MDTNSPSEKSATEGSKRGGYDVSIHELAISMVEELEEQPRLLRSTASSRDCSIYRVPPMLREINDKAYAPQLVSIGPYHHGREHLKMMEEHKGRILRDFIYQRKHWDADLASLLGGLQSLEDKIRNSYSELIDLKSSELIKMMLLDGVFVLEVLCRVNGLVPIDKDDPIFNVPWIFPFLLKDLLRLENQVPFFLLQHLFDISTEDKHPSLSLPLLALNFFNYGMPRPDLSRERYSVVEAKHLLDLFRSSLIPLNYKKPRKHRKVGVPLEVIPSSNKLWRSGIKLRARRDADSFLDITFADGVLEIPAVTIDDFTTCFFFNCMALEQCSGSHTMHITDYVALMGRLIETPGDASHLSELKIVENYIGSHEEVVGFFNNISKEVALDVDRSSYAELFEEVNRYSCKKSVALSVALRHAYFHHPWSLLAACAALLLLLLTGLQAFYAVLAYESPPK